jgi:FKBP-type peptidyl-prolyl isomerase-like protein
VRPGVELLADIAGTGSPVERHALYDVRLQMWLSRGDPVRWIEPWGVVDRARIEDEGTTLFTTLRVDRVSMFAGLFYGVAGMRVGGRRRLRVAPHLAFREAGVPGVIPPNALLTVEIEIVSERAV